MKGAKPGTKEREGRPAFAVTPSIRLQVQKLAAYGLTQAQTADVIGCSETTLKLRLGKEFKAGIPEADATVKNTLFQMAVSGQSVAATIFWVKARLGWSEKQRIEHSLDANAVQGLVGSLLAVLRQALPDTCPHCRVGLHLKAVIAKALADASARLGTALIGSMPAAPVAPIDSGDGTSETGEMEGA